MLVVVYPSSACSPSGAFTRFSNSPRSLVKRLDKAPLQVTVTLDSRCLWSPSSWGDRMPTARGNTSEAVTKDRTRAEGRPAASKAQVTETELRAMLATLPVTIQGVRDRALLLVGFVGAFRPVGAGGARRRGRGRPLRGARDRAAALEDGPGGRRTPEGDPRRRHAPSCARCVRCGRDSRGRRSQA